MSASTPCAADDPLLILWNKYKETEDYANSKNWASHRDYAEGSMWAAFMAGYLAATQRAADLHESINPASDDERYSKVPGAGAMGAVIEYRDQIRFRGATR